MKKLKFILPILALIVLFTSCNPSDDNPVVDETDGLQKVTEFSNQDHTIEMYTKSGKFYTGYNEISIRIKNNTDNTYFNDYTINWMPKMVMPSMTHSCPKSTISKDLEADSLYKGYLVFQMTNADNSGWSIKFIYTINNVEYTMEDTISVLQAPRQRVIVFTGSDGVKYILAMVNPSKPEIAINDMEVTLHKMENMMSFPVVENYTITLDPRMPSMGNHSSPNNTDLTYTTDKMMYSGDLSLTMTGYWKLNLKLLNPNGEVLKGEDITDDVLSSSLYLEIEF